MNKRLLVIQEHDAVKAGLHWDIRFEDEDEVIQGLKVLRSFAVPKHRLPNKKEQLLAIEVDVHPWNYRDFEGELTGYGKGTVKMIFNDYIDIDRFDDKKIIFNYNGEKYQIHKSMWLKGKNMFNFIKK
tara:strand:+ start:17 stop:400 length:384 start_codon:yes stop_codon:yes gene_type:complete